MQLKSPLPLLSPVRFVSPRAFAISVKPPELTETVIGAAIEVHRNKGPGLIESIYEWCLLKKLELRGLACDSQKVGIVDYKGFTREEPLRFDVFWRDCCW